MFLIHSAFSVGTKFVAVLLEVYVVVTGLALAGYNSLCILNHAGLLGKIICAAPAKHLNFNFLASSGRWLMCTFPAGLQLVLGKLLGSKAFLQTIGEKTDSATLYVVVCLMLYRAMTWVVRSVRPTNRFKRSKQQSKSW